MFSFQSITTAFMLLILAFGFSFSVQANEEEFMINAGIVLSESTQEYDIFVLNTEEDLLQVMIID